MCSLLHSLAIVNPSNLYVHEKIPNDKIPTKDEVNSCADSDFYC